MLLLFVDSEPEPIGSGGQHPPSDLLQLPGHRRLFRVEALKRVGLYSKLFPAAEDYELLRRVSCQYELANIPDFVMDYRISLEACPFSGGSASFSIVCEFS